MTVSIPTSFWIRIADGSTPMRLWVHPLGGDDLDARHELSPGQLRAPARPRGQRDLFDAGGRRDGVPRHHRRLMARHDARDVVADLLDVLGRGAAAAAHDARARL